MSDSRRAVRWLGSRAGTHIQVRIAWLGDLVASFEGVCAAEPGDGNLDGVSYRIGNDACLVIPEQSGARYRIDDDELVIELSKGVEIRAKSDP